MNPTDQRKHTIAVKELERQTEAIAVAVAERMDALMVGIEKAQREAEHGIAVERERRRKAIDELRVYVDLEDKITRGMIAAFRERGFLSRLNWLVTGR